jgi:hypothetical protein
VGNDSAHKIFGIGLGKTGTTSLHFALELLGFRSAHAPTVISKFINHEARTGKPLLSTLEPYYDAFIDWPISSLYSQLDRRFPGSKFILTIRDPLARYHSACRHMEYDRARMRQGLPYAWLSLEPEALFVLRDMLHTAAVKSYFEGRSEDLLVTRIVDGEAWQELCGFLRRPVPCAGFPHHKALGSEGSHFLRRFPVKPEPVNVDLTAWR